MKDMSAAQWRPFLSSFVKELTQNLTPTLLAQVMRRSGARFAHDRRLAPAATVADMELAMNLVWREMGWGEVTIKEAPDWLELTHRNAPLEATFGVDNQAWSVAFLEGAYEAWMHQLGADPRLRMTTANALDVSGSMVFRFGQ